VAHQVGFAGKELVEVGQELLGNVLVLRAGCHVENGELDPLVHLGLNLP